MSEKSRAPVENRISEAFPAAGQSPDRALKNFRYVVASVNDSALAVWAELWQELRNGATANGLASPGAEQGFQPSCGWAEFLEKFWLLKHYLDYIHRFSK